MILEAFFIYATLQGNAFLQPAMPPQEVRIVMVTAYSSTIDQCDADPFITASNKKVRDGVVAANFLKFGTKVMFPEIFPDKVFIVEDRMNRKYKNTVDIWMDKTSKAKNFGIKRAKMVIL